MDHQFQQVKNLLETTNTVVLFKVATEYNNCIDSYKIYSTIITTTQTSYLQLRYYLTIQ